LPDSSAREPSGFQIAIYGLDALHGHDFEDAVGLVLRRELARALRALAVLLDEQVDVACADHFEDLIGYFTGRAVGRDAKQGPGMRRIHLRWYAALAARAKG